jgi:crotonobetainyl-CoA:carnitine CoA-transferase CaiB-like acyl-CoA transferase
MKPLDGVTVIDLTSVVSGPLATMLLAKLGADVVKVEAPPGGDDLRVSTIVQGRPLIFEWCNTGKRSIGIDLKTSAGRSVLRRLVESADVFVHSFAPGVVERLGITDEDIRSWQPEALYCEVSAFGGGPVGSRLRGYDALIQAFTGIMDMTGHPDAPPVRCAPSIVDMSNGLWLTIGIVGALLSRSQGVPVHHLEAALVDAGMAFVPWQAAGALLTGERPRRRGASHGLAAPQDLYDAADAPIFVVAGNQRLWQRLVLALDAPELASDPRFSGPKERGMHEHELKHELNVRFKANTASAWLDKLTDAGVPASVLHGVNETVLHPIEEERNWFEYLDGFPNVRFPVLADHQIIPTRSLAPRYGQHTLEILEELRLDRAAIDRLVVDNVVAVG